MQRLNLQASTLSARDWSQKFKELVCFCKCLLTVGSPISQFGVTQAIIDRGFGNVS